MPFLRSGKNYTMKNTKQNNIHKKPIIIFYDLETTGLNPYHHEIIEIGAYRLYDKKLKKFNHLIKPDIELSSKITDITGIKNEDLIDKSNIDIIISKFISFILENIDEDLNQIYLIAHNNDSFDELFLKINVSKYFQYQPQICNQFKFIDTLRLTQKLYKDRFSYSLSSLSKTFNIIQQNAHRALCDVDCMFTIYLRICDKLYPHFGLTNKEELLHRPDLIYNYIYENIK